MARAKASTWLGIFAGLAWGSLVWADPPDETRSRTGAGVGDAKTEMQVCQASTSSRVRFILKSAMDAHQRGDYEQAETLIHTTLASVSELTPDDQKELNALIQRNHLALQAQREGTELLNRAGEAERAKRFREANELLRKVAANQYLSSLDKQKAQALAERVRVRMSGNPIDGPVNLDSHAPTDPHAKLAEARSRLAVGDLDGATRLAHEVEDMHAKYQIGQDTPQQILAAVARLRSDAKGLLSTARTALQHGDLDRAEALARASEKAESAFSFHMWGDSPAKVLKDVRAARAKQAQAIQKPAENSPMSKESSGMLDSIKGMFVSKKQTTGDDRPVQRTSQNDIQPAGRTESKDPNTEKARQILKQARKSLDAGKLREAGDLAGQARALNPHLEWWDETPDRIQADIDRTLAQRTGKTTEAKTKEPAPSQPTDPRVLVHQGRKLLEQGKYDEAMHLAQKARLGHFTRWGLFEDTPNKLIVDIKKARLERDQQEADRLLADARKKFEQANHDPAKLTEAAKTAYKARTLHGPYSILHLGDTPDKLLAEIEEERLKNRQVIVPPVPGTGNVAEQKPADLEMQLKQAREMMAQALAAQQQGNNALALQLVTQVERMGLPSDQLGAWDPERLKQYLVQNTQASPGLSPSLPPPAPPADQARHWLEEAHQLQQAGHLIEARQKAIQAQSLSATFTPQEETPERFLLRLTETARSQIRQLEQQADREIASAPGDPAACSRAEGVLFSAKQLANQFQLPTQEIEARLSQVRSQIGMSRNHGSSPPIGGPEPIARVNVTDGGMQAQGRELLEKARMEIKTGQTAMARRLAGEVFLGPYGLQKEAQDLLRIIDMEENNQRMLTARREFDAAISAFQRRDYQHASLILHAINPSLLDPYRLDRLKELMQIPELQTTAVRTASVQGQSPGSFAPGGNDPNSSLPMGLGATAGQARASDDSREANYAQQMAAMQNIKFQKLRRKALETQLEASEHFKAGDTDQALQILQDFLAELPDAGLDPTKTALLRRPVEDRLQRLKTLKMQMDVANAGKQEQQIKMARVKAKVDAEEHKQQQVKELMQKYNSLFKEGKYKDAEMYAQMAMELDPDNPVTAAAVNMAKVQRRHVEYQKLKTEKEDMFVNSLNDAESEGPDAVTTLDPIRYNKAHWDRVRNREKALTQMGTRLKTPQEKELEHILSTKMVTINFKNRPLGEALEELRVIHGINMHYDRPAMEQEGINLDDRRISETLENVSLRTVLDLMLGQVHLIHTIKEGVVWITTEANARGKMDMRTYQVGDLVIPVEDYGTVQGGPEVLSPLGQSIQKSGANSAPTGMQAIPYQGSNSMYNSGTPVGSPSGSWMNNDMSSSSWNRRTVQTRQDQLIQLIINAIAPKSWQSMGGQGSIDYFPATMTLVVNQTPDILEQIEALLAQLRRMQDQEVAVEVRFISIAESFYERIGVNFNVNLVTNKNTQKYQPLITSGQFAPAGYLQDFSPSRFLSGLTPAGTFTSDLNIPIQTSSFGMAIPPFGAFPNAPGANGGIDLGLAFLSDVQVFLFMEAAQGDQRTNVMQAPKLTMFNGQTATLQVFDQQYFVTGTRVFNNGGQLTFQPTNTPIPTSGVFLTIQAVISADRRFVRMSMTPSLTNLASAVVPLFPIVVPIQTMLEGGILAQPVVFTQYIQQPVFNSISVQTTVAVPDGGTVLMGGLKRLSEGRNEFGPPVLSKIPYINRLFKNVGYGKQAESLMIMVTPRIIINEEEEERQTGRQPPINVP